MKIVNHRSGTGNSFKVKVLIFFTLLAVPFGCQEFLDELPDNRVTLDNLEKAAQLLTNAYSVSSYAFNDWMTDNVQFTRGVTLRQHHTAAYLWDEFLDDPGTSDTPAFFWFETYNAIAHANEVLAALESFPVVTEEDQSRKNAVESEALLTRAYGHFMLVNLFAKHYQSSTASSDPGVPYVETPETVLIQEYRRNSVQEVYDKVEADMLRGIELVDDSFFANSGKYHFNRNAALAFASRFYLFKEDYEQCIAFSNQMLGGSPGNFVRDLTAQEFQEASSSFTVYPQLYSSPDQAANLLLIRKISLVQRPDFAHSPTTSFYFDLFDNNPFNATDQRTDPAFAKGDNGVFPSRYESLFERTSLNSNVGFPYHIAIALRGEEVLLNRAESYALTNRIDDAIADLQVLTDRRYDGTNELTLDIIRNFVAGGNPFISNQVAVREYILFERRKEFLGQGLRWFDIKRYELEVDHVLADDVSTITLQRNDLRKVLQIPSSAVDVGGLRPNPR